MIRLFNTVAFRLAMGYGILVLCAVAVISAILYLGTVEVMDRESKSIGSALTWYWRCLGRGDRSRRSGSVS
jgi:hypothetical protein